MGINLNKILSQRKAWGVFSGNGSFLKESIKSLDSTWGRELWTRETLPERMEDD